MGRWRDLYPKGWGGSTAHPRGPGVYDRRVSDLGASLTPLAGGHSGRTFASEVAGQRAVVRIHPPGDSRGEAAPEIDAAVLHLVRGLVPVPEVLEVRRENASTGQPGLLVTSWLPGERGDVVVDRLVRRNDAEGLARLGRAMGEVAGTLSGMPMLRPGTFLDADLALGRLPADGLPEWVEGRLAAWPAAQRARLVAVAGPAQDLLDTLGRACLVHSDLNPKNVLVDAEDLSLTGVLDWEFAHAGHPWTDLGNLLRFERHPAYVDAVLDAWTGLRGGRPEDVLQGARAADLWALVELAARAGDNPVADRAATVLRAIAESGDLHAWPYAR